MKTAGKVFAVKQKGERDDDAGKCMILRRLDNIIVTPKNLKILSECSEPQKTEALEAKEPKDLPNTPKGEDGRLEPANADEVLKHLQEFYLDTDTDSNSVKRQKKRTAAAETIQTSSDLQIDNDLKLFRYSGTGSGDGVALTGTRSTETPDLMDRITEEGRAAFEQDYFPILEIARGADGIVYFAMKKTDFDASVGGHSRNIKNICAVKFSPRLAKELKNLKCLPSHPQLVQLLDYEQNRPGRERWLTMSAVTGVTFRDFVSHWRAKNMPAPYTFACHALAQLGGALSFLHGWTTTKEGCAMRTPFRGITHGDIHGHNVMVAPSFRDSTVWPDLKIIDFGRAVLEPLQGSGRSALKNEEHADYEDGVRTDWAELGNLIHNTAYNCRSLYWTDCTSSECVKSAESYFFSQRDAWFQNWARDLAPANLSKINESCVLQDLVKRAKSRRNRTQERQRPKDDIFEKLRAEPATAPLLTAAFERSMLPNPDPTKPRGPPTMQQQQQQQLDKKERVPRYSGEELPGPPLGHAGGEELPVSHLDHAGGEELPSPSSVYSSHEELPCPSSVYSSHEELPASSPEVPE